MKANPRWLQVAGWSGVGKTTILEELILRAKSRGERVFAVKLSDHSAVEASGDSGRLLQQGADLSAMVGPDGVSWQGSRSLFAETLIRLQADWVFVEGGRMLPTPKILLASEDWPTYSPPVIAGLGRKPAGFAQTASFALPDESSLAADWIDVHRLACSVPSEQWMPIIQETFGA